jgi:hypothetical protein
LKVCHYFGILSTSFLFLFSAFLFLSFSIFLIPLAAFSKDTSQAGPRLKFQVPGNVNSLNACVKSRVTPPILQSGTSVNVSGDWVSSVASTNVTSTTQSGAASSSSSVPQSPNAPPHAQQLPLSLQQGQAQFAAEKPQGTVTISTIAILNDVKIAVDPSFKLTRFDPIFTRKFLSEGVCCFARFRFVVVLVLLMLIKIFFK